MVDGAAATVASGQFDAGFLQFRYIRLQEWILMASDHNARIVWPEHQHMMIGEIEIAIEPIFQR